MGKIALVAFAALLLVGCEDRYRYPCQDPANYGDPMCQRPACLPTRDCSDMLNKGLKKQAPAPAMTPAPKPIKGDCK